MKTSLRRRHFMAYVIDTPSSLSWLETPSKRCSTFFPWPEDFIQVMVIASQNVSRMSSADVQLAEDSGGDSSGARIEGFIFCKCFFLKHPFELSSDGWISYYIILYQTIHTIRSIFHYFIRWTGKLIFSCVFFLMADYRFTSRTEGFICWVSKWVVHGRERMEKGGLFGVWILWLPFGKSLSLVCINQL